MLNKPTGRVVQWFLGDLRMPSEPPQSLLAVGPPTLNSLECGWTELRKGAVGGTLLL